jgi:hypothetical protein
VLTSPDLGKRWAPRSWDGLGVSGVADKRYANGPTGWWSVLQIRLSGEARFVWVLDHHLPGLVGSRFAHGEAVVGASA